MPSERQATVFTRLQPGRRRSSSTPARNLIGIVLIVLSLFEAAALLRAAASDEGRRLRASHADSTAAVGAPERARAVESRTGVVRMAASGEVRLFLGYLEFDWDGEAPGGVPGFGRWPPSPPPTDVVAASLVEK
jgi:hypothetical protein